MVSSQSLSNKQDRREAQHPRRRRNNNNKSLPYDDRQSDHTTKTKERTKNVDNPSSIAEHEESTGHPIDWENFRGRVAWQQRLSPSDQGVVGH